MAFAGVTGAAAFAAGCGKSESGPNQPPVASIETALRNGPPAAASAVAVDPADARLREIDSLLAEVRRAGETDERETERLRRAVAGATEVIAATHSAPDRQAAFDRAAAALSEAQAGLAFAGDPSGVDALYQDAAAFHHRDPGSLAAAGAAYHLARFAALSAERERTAEWAAEAAHSACLFADRFPSDRRATDLLWAAGRVAERANLTDTARRCYAVIATRPAEADDAAYAVGSLRRLKLIGGHVQLAGPTLDGRFVSADAAEFRGRCVLILFWSRDTAGMELLAQELRRLQVDLHDQVAVIGVTADAQEYVHAFVTDLGLLGDQILDGGSERTGGTGRIGVYYGVRNLPALWLIDCDGRVRSTMLSAATAADAVRKTLQHRDP